MPPTARTGRRWEGASTPASTTATSDQDGGFPRRLRPAQVGVTSNNSRRYARKIRSNWSGSWRNRSRTDQLRGLASQPRRRAPRAAPEASVRTRAGCRFPVVAATSGSTRSQGSPAFCPPYASPQAVAPAADITRAVFTASFNSYI